MQSNFGIHFVFLKASDTIRECNFRYQNCATESGNHIFRIHIILNGFVANGVQRQVF